MLAAAVSLTFAATACTSSAGHTAARTTSSASPAPAAAPALTRKEALARIDHYSKINNRANRSNNRALLDTVEDGPLYAMSVADYKQAEGLPRADRTPYKPWSYDTASADVYIPRIQPGGQRWFAAVTYTGRNHRYARLLVMAQQPTTRRWEMVSAVDLDSKKQIPQIALDADGYATAVDAASATAVTTPVAALRAAVVDDYVTGGTTTGTTVFARTKALTQQIKAHDKTTTKFGARGTTVFTNAATRFEDSYALKTTDGALVVFAHAHRQTDTAHTGWQINPGKDDRAWLGRKGYVSIAFDFTCSDVAAVPRTSGKARLLAYTCRRTAAHGTPAG
ncbi:hypothetical protein OK074_5013 [Actinobacteria bacterium OK074]|nr:hypothetical protein OK074_5013 [Actinobacteria bacterium OK074]